MRAENNCEHTHSNSAVSCYAITVWSDIELRNIPKGYALYAGFDESVTGSFDDVKGITNVAGAWMRRSGAPALRGAATYRIAVGPQAGRKVFTLQTLAACEPDEFADSAGKVSGFSLPAGVAARSDERKKLERLCEGGPAVTLPYMDVGYLGA